VIEPGRIAVTYYHVIGPDSASTAIAAATPKSTMTLNLVAKRIAQKLHGM
jgi:hypothetical protein